MDSFLKSRIPGATNFVWKDALYLPRWDVCCVPTDDQEDQIIKTAFKLEQVRSFFGADIKINCWLRPLVYNMLIGGAKDSAHIYGMAVDFWVKGFTPDQVRTNLQPHLEDLKIRMENKPASSWVHIDIRDPSPNRFFIP